MGKFHMEYAVKKRDMEIHNLEMETSESHGTFKIPKLKKVNKFKMMGDEEEAKKAEADSIMKSRTGLKDQKPDADACLIADSFSLGLNIKDLIVKLNPVIFSSGQRSRSASMSNQ